MFRLTIPLLYALVVPTLLSDWYYAHYTLANVIWYILLAVTVLSWVYSLVRKISAIMERRRREKEKEEILIQRVREAGRNGGGRRRSFRIGRQHSGPCRPREQSGRTTIGCVAGCGCPGRSPAPCGSDLANRHLLRRSHLRKFHARECDKIEDPPVGPEIRESRDV